MATLESSQRDVFMPGLDRAYRSIANYNNDNANDHRISAMKDDYYIAQPLTFDEKVSQAEQNASRAKRDVGEPVFAPEEHDPKVEQAVDQAFDAYQANRARTQVEESKYYYKKEDYRSTWQKLYNIFFGQSYTSGEGGVSRKYYPPGPEPQDPVPPVLSEAAQTGNMGDLNKNPGQNVTANDLPDSNNYNRVDLIQVDPETGSTVIIQDQYDPEYPEVTAKQVNEYERQINDEFMAYRKAQYDKVMAQQDRVAEALSPPSQNGQAQEIATTNMNNGNGPQKTPPVVIDNSKRPDGVSISVNDLREKILITNKGEGVYAVQVQQLPSKNEPLILTKRGAMSKNYDFHYHKYLQSKVYN